MRFRSESDRWLTINALRRAAIDNREYAKTARESFRQEIGVRISAQMEQQAADRERIAREIEEEAAEG